ncbi:MAG: TIGR03435 family protein [Pyrinomonadaceae bacterium]|nr:TIGR03435 family protein [Pyrinomonadaceae bacterium]
MKKIFIVVLVSISCVVGFKSEGTAQERDQAEGTSIRIGDAPPELKLTNVLQENNGNISLAELKGKIVVLEFWATWCSPCIPAMEHLNKVAVRFKDEPVKFIAITDENEERVRSFLRKVPFSGVIGLDELGETRKSYDFQGFPHTIIVDKNGKIAAITDPKNVTEEVIASLLEGNEISLPIKGVVPPNLKWDNDLINDHTLFQTIIAQSGANRGGFYSDTNKLTFDGIALIDLLRVGFRVSPRGADYNIGKVELYEQKYRASVFVPKSKSELLYPTFQRLLKETFNIKTRFEKRKTLVFVLKIKEETKISLKQSTSLQKQKVFGKGSIDSKKQSLSELAKTLENFVQRPVVDETGLDGEYDLNLEYNFGDRTVLLNSLSKTMGLELVEAERIFEFIIFERE